MIGRLVLALALVAWPAAARAQVQDDTGHPRHSAPLTILQLNDVYSTVPVNGAGGLARVATIKKQVAASGHAPFLMIAGDFLSSSVASTVFKGEQMVAALNAAGLDLATLGNHEFDFGLDVLLQRMSEATFDWVIANVIDSRTGRPVGGAAPYVIRTFGSLKVGVLGLCLTSDSITRDKLQRIRLIDPIDAAATYIPEMKKAGADVIVALTHLAYADDLALAERFPEIDLIVGGHEHFPITATAGRTLISKAGTEARFVARIDVERTAAGTVQRFYELLPVTSAIEEDPETAAVVASFESRLGPELDKTVGSTRSPLDGVSQRLRSSERNLGNLVADAVRASVDADIAIVNSGGIRGDRMFPSGPLTRRTLLAILPFGNTVCKLAVPGRVVMEALQHGVSRLPAPAGQFPQVSGVRFRVDANASGGPRVHDVIVNGEPLDPQRVYTLALPDYVLLGGDGYVMFPGAGSREIIGPDLGPLLVTALEDFIAGREIVATNDDRITIDQ